MEMKICCETCSKPLSVDGLAYICSYTCTYCADCADASGLICRNCHGELVRRPRRKVDPVDTPPAERELPA